MNNNTFCRYGPLIRLLSMRFEGKHKMLKKSARTTSFKNVCQTLCKPHQRLHAYNLYCNSTFTAVTIETGKGKPNSSVVCHLCITV